MVQGTPVENCVSDGFTVWSFRFTGGIKWGDTPNC